MPLAPLPRVPASDALAVTVVDDAGALPALAPGSGAGAARRARHRNQFARAPRRGAHRALARRQSHRGLVPPLRTSPALPAPSPHRRRSRNLPPLTDPALRTDRRPAPRPLGPEGRAQHQVRLAGAPARRASSWRASPTTRCWRASSSIPGRRSHAIDALSLEHLGRGDAQLHRPHRQGKGADSVRRGASRGGGRLLRRRQRHGARRCTTVFAPELQEHGAGAAAGRPRVAAGPGAGGHGVGRHRDRPAALRPALAGHGRGAGAARGRDPRRRPARRSTSIRRSSSGRCSSSSTSCRCSRRRRPDPRPTPRSWSSSRPWGTRCPG